MTRLPSLVPNTPGATYPSADTPPRRDAPFTLLRAAQVIDGRGGVPIQQGAVLLEGVRIHAVGPQSNVAAPAGAAVELLDYPAGTILPGLIDAHTHLNGFGDGRRGDDLAQLPDELLLLQAARNARAHLESGVTTLRDCGSKGRTAFMLREAVRQGIATGPRLILSGRPVTITGGHLWYFGSEADGVDAVRRMVRQLVKEGADFIKIVATGGSTRTSYPSRPSYTVDELRAIVDEAHTFGKPTAAHCASIQGTMNALEAGVDTIVHCMFVEPDGSVQFRPEVAERLAERGAWADCTVAQSWMRILALRAKEARGEALAAAEQREVAQLERAREVRKEHFRRLLDAGAKMVSGSDSSWAWYPMGRFQYEIIGHAEWGMGPMAAILSGTRDAATCLGVDDETGTLEAGKAADVLVVDGDPLQDIWSLLRVRDVFLGGRRVARAEAGPPLPLGEAARQGG
ncbi:MAG: amidohydrolase family protein [Chloroflexi bacterium]|nr:amidohydrolase family protein [Chloroflexota bacterium]